MPSGHSDKLSYLSDVARPEYEVIALEVTVALNRQTQDVLLCGDADQSKSFHG